MTAGSWMSATRVSRPAHRGQASTSNPKLRCTSSAHVRCGAHPQPAVPAGFDAGSPAPSRYVRDAADTDGPGATGVPGPARCPCAGRRDWRVPYGRIRHVAAAGIRQILRRTPRMAGARHACAASTAEPTTTSARAYLMHHRDRVVSPAELTDHRSSTAACCRRCFEPEPSQTAVRIGPGHLDRPLDEAVVGNAEWLQGA